MVKQRQKYKEIHTRANRKTRRLQINNKFKIRETMKTFKSCILLFLMWCALFATAGIECGIDYTINRLVLGIRATRDRRGDFEFYNESPEMRNSGFIKIGWKL